MRQWPIIWRKWGRLFVLLSGGLVAWWLTPCFFALPDALKTARDASVRFTARDGQPLRQLLTADGQRTAEPVAFDAVPKVLIDATLAAEDKRFFAHSGIDWLAMARALRGNLLAGRVVSGASTITQQLVKISGPADRRTLASKFAEAMRARRLEREWSKKEILAAYLNRVSYGNLFTGCASATEGYFHKPLSDLTAAEAAFLAALPQAPGRMNPFRDATAALKRQQRILTLMHESGWLNAAELEVARTQEIKLQRFAGGFAAPHAVELAAAGLAGNSASDGGREGDPSREVRTTIDIALQRQVEGIIRSRLNGLESRHVTHAAVVVIENATGDVLALAGSRDFFAPDGGQINGAWVPHSPGSAMKPFTYELAFEKGWTPASIVADLPVEYATTTGNYTPENYGHKVYGPMTCRTALGNSLNISAVKVLQHIGGPQVLLARLQALGLTTLTDPAEHYGLGLTIGNAPVRLVELANAYACLARLGVVKPWRLVAGGDVAGVRLMDEARCYLIADILSDNQARLLTFGAHSALRLPFRVAVKTGTSSTYRDNWTLGYTPWFTVGVWAGNFDNTPMQNVSGVTGAAPVFRDVFLELEKRSGTTWYEKPAGIVRSRIDPRTGRRLTPQSPAARMSRDEIFVAGTEPPAAEAGDYEMATGRAILPPEYSAWVKSRDNWMGDLVTCGESSDAARVLRIVNPIAGTVIRLDPDIPNGGNRLILQSAPAAGVRWSSPTLEVRTEAGRAVAILKPGRHEITATLDDSAARTFVIVEQE
ncbi:MAG: penicillin-binding protein 1C [Verrucomicrobiaceae bacterium]|nr:penicillin-binding protein 1C [Verrucomicrobiaceae bacterium]